MECQQKCPTSFVIVVHLQQVVCYVFVMFSGSIFFPSIVHISSAHRAITVYVFYGHKNSISWAISCWRRSVLLVCAGAKKYIKASHGPNSHYHMVLWWERNADLLCVALQLRIPCFTWLLASVGRAALASWGGSSWWCQRKSCPSLPVSFVGPMFTYLKKKRNTARLFTVQRRCWQRGLWQSDGSNLRDATLILVPCLTWTHLLRN